MAKGERYGWLRGALADKDLKAADVARAWGVDDSVLSRFIRHGTPSLTLDRMEILARMLGCDFNTLQVKFATRPVPPAALRPDSDPAPSILQVPHHPPADILAELRFAIDKARPRLAASGFKIHVNLEYAGDAI